MTEVTFRVDGTPRPKGSFKFIRGRSVPSSKYVLKWQETVSWAARAEWPHSAVGAPNGFGLGMVFYVKISKPRAEWWPFATNRGDIDKLARAICDALTGIVYEDDRQVVALDCRMRFVKSEADCGAQLRIWSVPHDDLLDEVGGVGGTA